MVLKEPKPRPEDVEKHTYASSPVDAVYPGDYTGLPDDAPTGLQSPKEILARLHQQTNGNGAKCLSEKLTTAQNRVAHELGEIQK